MGEKFSPPTQRDEYERWEQVIAKIRMQYKGLRLLKEEMKLAGL